MNEALMAASAFIIGFMACAVIRDMRKKTKVRPVHSCADCDMRVGSGKHICILTHGDVNYAVVPDKCPLPEAVL